MRARPTPRRRGFTLIELLIAMLVIGILASLAMPRLRATRGKATLAAIKSDLQNLATAQEAFFAEFNHYTTTIDSLSAAQSPGVILTLVEGTGTGWSATAYHPSSFPRTCALFFGNAAAVAPATVGGTVTCN